MTERLADDERTRVVLTADALPVGSYYDWAVDPGCGAVVVFSGTVRDHSDGRTGVAELDYEAYEEPAIERCLAIAGEIRRQWPTAGRIVLAHRTGRLAVGESSVVVVVSAPHRPEAFAAARFGIDALKETVPIWKRERWTDGSDWAVESRDIRELSDFVASRGRN